jgi:hypothetical protein
MAWRRGQRYGYFTTKKRVAEGLRRAAESLWGGDEKRLPSSAKVYSLATREEEPGRSRRLYPSETSIYEFFSSMNEAWLAAGYLVETVVRKVAHEVITPEVHERLKVCYQHAGKKPRQRPAGVPTLRELGAELGVSHKLLGDYARRQGWVKGKEKPWTRAELRLLDKYAHLAPLTIQQRLKAAGVIRSEMSIRVMRVRRKAHKGAPYYSLTAVCRLLGIDSHKFDRDWLVRFPDELPFELKGTAPKRQCGDVKLLHIDTLRNFICAHPEEIDLAKVDKLWFLWLVTGGGVKMVAPSDRLSMRVEAYQPDKVKEHRTGRKKAEAAG